MREVRVTKAWKLFITTSITLLLISACNPSRAATPTIFVTDQVQIASPSGLEPGTTPSPENSPAPSNTQVPPTPIISPNATVAFAGEITVTEEKKTYPLLSPADLYGNPGSYEGKRFMVEGVVLGIGYRKFEGKDVYIIQVGVLDYPRPIIVLGFLPNPKLGMHDGFIVGGTGGGAYYGVDSADPMSYTPVILGEWYECNLPWDQWKYPYEFWTPIQLEPASVN